MKDKKNPKLMIVDVEKDVCGFVKSFFEERNFEVVYAHNSLDALPMVEKEKPDVLLMDIKLPGMSGLDALPYIKTINPGTKVVIVTSIDDQEKINEAMTRGAESYITKPLLLEDLLETVKKVCLISDLPEKPGKKLFKNKRK